ncbi:hypothetical protein M9Y10_014011 [Tritrichomonas musculus]|uniref:Transmembrane protein n=1 Tax=Tritrichomonas musculus TaxID=1915356 RepID=A0ABR2KYF4_9EUKA
MKNKKQTKKDEEKNQNGFTVYDYFAIIGTIVLLIFFSILLYVLYDILQSADLNSDKLTLAKKHFGQLLQTINQANDDKSIVHHTKFITESLENATIAGPIYQLLVNYSIYDKALYAIESRSTICREKIHRQAVNELSKLLTKMITLSGYKFGCNTQFIKEYLPVCFSHHKKFKSVFSLIDAMMKTSCSKEVHQSIIRAIKQSQNFYFKFRLVQFLDQYPDLNQLNVDNTDTDENLICSLTENAVESLPQSLDKETQKDFCNFVDNHKCTVFTDQSIVDLCQKEKIDDSL